MDVLSKTGFTSYFLITWDFIDYAKRNGIPVGPGRGSAAGSLIAYVLGITDLDPLQYGLFFERFLNPERISPPDIDVDFCYNRRGEVIEYVRKKYGERSVAQIITFGTLGAKMAIRDVGRVMGLSYGEADRLAKMIPFDPKMTLEKALEESPDFKRAYDEEEITRQRDRFGADAGRRFAAGGRARGGRGDFGQGPGRLRAADARRPRRHRDAVLDGAAGRAGPAEDGLPRTEDADGDPGRAEPDRGDDGHENRRRWKFRSMIRRDLRLAEPGAKHRRVPGGIAGHVRRCAGG